MDINVYQAKIKQALSPGLQAMLFALGDSLLKMVQEFELNLSLCWVLMFRGILTTLTQVLPPALLHNSKD